MDIKLGIIDIDGLLYHSVKDTLEESIEKFKDKFQNIIDQTRITHYVGFYSKGKYFRHNIFPEYKIGRVGRDTPKYLKTLKEWAIAEYNLQNMYQVEADDLCAYWMNSNRISISWNVKGVDLVNPEDSKKYNIEKILCTPDKDLLESIPGKHFNYSYKLKDDIKALVKSDVLYQPKDEDVIKGWWIATTPNIADQFKLMQLVVGDPSDGIKGIEGKGIKYWEKMVDNSTYYLDNILLEYFQKYGISQGVFEFQKNYRLLHMLENDEDFMREIGTLPEFPTITEVVKEITDEPKIEF